jgi:hypothetical protein
LNLELSVTKKEGQLPDWLQPLQTLSSIPGLQLRLLWEGLIDDLDHPCVSQWLKQYGQLISHPILTILVSEHRLKLKDFSEAAASCKSMDDLQIWHNFNDVVDLADLAPLNGSLKSLSCMCSTLQPGIFMGASALMSMPQLTALHLGREDLRYEEPWGWVASLTSLQQLSLEVSATGDPSPLSELLELSSLKLQSLKLGADGLAPFSFSSLQPLSTLQRLEVLHLRGHACAATSLKGLPKLRPRTGLPYSGGRLRDVEGVIPRVVDLRIEDAQELVSLDGIEGCTSMERLSLASCGVSSLEPLRGLSSMKQLEVSYCLKIISLQPLSQLGEGLQKLRVTDCRRVREEILELPHVQPTADVEVRQSNVREVVLAGEKRLTCHR